MVDVHPLSLVLFLFVDHDTFPCAAVTEVVTFGYYCIRYFYTVFHDEHEYNGLTCVF